jgi:phytoene dehydrogenase-like protein
MSAAAGKHYDCIVVGGGHNGLVCAAYLARGGRRVLVLEAAPQVGGAAVTREFASGFKVSAGAHLLHLMPPALMRELALERHGLKLAASALPSVALAADGAHLVLEAGRLSGAAGQPVSDAPAYAEWRERMQRLAASLHPLLAAPPPRLGSDAWRERASLLALGWRIRRLGRADMRELLRIGGMCVYDLLQEHFESPLLQGALALDALLGTNYGPRSPGTVFTLLYRLAASGTDEILAQPQGGLGALSQALARAASAAGAEIRTGQAVARILVQSDRVRGVVLESGEELGADTVVSSADPKTTFLQLLGSEHLDAGFTRRVTRLRARGVAAKVHLALERLPDFPGLTEAQLRGRLLVAPSLDYLERAYNHSKYREFSPAPMLEITVPTLADPTLAAPGTHVMSVIAQYAPYALEGGWTGAARQRFTDQVLDGIARYAPQLRSCLRATELLTPADMEREFRIVGGHWHHAELALDQFFMVRPLPGAAQYRAPVPGLYLCGAACHPGGGVMGLAGRNAARQLLSEAA